MTAPILLRSRRLPSAHLQKEHAHVKDNVFSDDLSRLTLTLDPKFRYLGSFPFDIHDIAGGYRYVWGEIDHGKHLRRTFIIQAEGFYPDNQEVVPLRHSHPVALAGDAYQHKFGSTITKRTLMKVQEPKPI